MNGPESERQDTKERAQLASIYLTPVRCAGGRLIHKDYCCPWCGSVNPSFECSKPRKGWKDAATKRYEEGVESGRVQTD